jgi:hypothetical protein
LRACVPVVWPVTTSANCVCIGARSHRHRPYCVCGVGHFKHGVSRAHSRRRHRIVLRRVYANLAPFPRGLETKLKLTFQDESVPHAGEACSLVLTDVPTERAEQ